MVAANTAGPPAYTVGPFNNTTLAPIVDPNDNIIPTAPIPDLAPPQASAGGYQSSPMQVLSAILVELRVISTLLQANTTTTLDLGALRADEASGATGGALN